MLTVGYVTFLDNLVRTTLSRSDSFFISISILYLSLFLVPLAFETILQLPNACSEREKTLTGMNILAIDLAEVNSIIGQT